MGKRRVIAETGAGQHGVATATVAALFGMECRVFMGEEDIRRQAPNVLRMKILGAEVVPVTAGSATLKDAMNEAMRHWVTYVRDTFYIIGSVAGPHPYPMMVRDFQSVIGRETRRQILKQEGRLPDCIIACVGGGSNAMGIFYPFRNDENVKLIGVEAAGLGIATGMHSASISAGTRRRAPRQQDLPLAGRSRADPRGPLGGGRARLPRRGTRAQLFQEDGAGRLCLRRGR